MRHLRPEGHEECDVRIRELEAELQRTSDTLRITEAGLKARAEKAEARVAELERQLDEARSPSMHEYGDECYEFVAENPPEREAD